MSATRDRLVEDIATMVGDVSYNHAPINYTIAEKAIDVIHRDLFDRLEDAAEQLLDLADWQSEPNTAEALRNKARGVSLALSYVRELSPNAK